MKNTFWCLLTLLLFGSHFLAAQQIYTLSQVIDLAKGGSLSAKQADNRKENRYWAFQSFRANYKPRLVLSGSLPDFSRRFSGIQQPDGSISFQEVSQNFGTASLFMEQNIAATGTRVFVNTELQRFDNFQSDFTSYNGTPFSIGFDQPLFFFNELKWNKKIEPLRYEESVKKYSEDLEQVSLQASNLFFNTLLAQISLELAKKNLANNDTIYRIARGRYDLGKIAENELLQLELNTINSKQQLSQATLDLETSSLSLNSFMGIFDNSTLILIEPNEVPDFVIDPDLALQKAKDNRQQYLGFKRQQLEAERDVAQAQGETGLNMNLSGTFGLSQTSQTIGGLYQDPIDQQTLRLGFTIPVLDFGRQKARVKTALANQDLINSTVEQERLNFEQEIYVKVKQFPILRDRLKAAVRADEVADKRYEIAQNRYLVSKISITDLNIALQEKDRAKQAYLQAMRDFWNAYYEIRMLTLYDFEKNEDIVYSDR